MARKPNSPLIQCTNFQWRLFVRDGVFYADGRRGTVKLGKFSLGTRSQAEALERLQALDEMKSIELGKTPVEVALPASNLTIKEGWDQYRAQASRPLVIEGASAPIIKSYQAVRDHHVAFCALNAIEIWTEFTNDSLEKFAQQRGKTQASRTVYLELATIRSVSKWLVDENFIPPECQLQYPLARPQGTVTYCYSNEEVGAIIKHCNLKGLRWLANLVVLLSHTGMRLSEAIELRWTDVDIAKGIRVADRRFNSRKAKVGTAHTSKGDSSRVIPVHPSLEFRLADLERHRDGRVLHDLQGGKLQPRNVLTTFIDQVIEPLKERFPTAKGEIGFEHGRLDSFRHFFCYSALMSGVSEVVVYEWLGHEEWKMFEHYRYLSSEDAARRIAETDFLTDEDERASDDADSKAAPLLIVNEEATQVLME